MNIPQNPVAVYTVHKAASMLLHWISEDICNELSIPYYSPNIKEQKPLFDQATNTGPLLAEALPEGVKCIGPCRRPAYIPGNEEYNIILHLRDPRDGLNSMFFSFTKIHGGISEKVRKRRWRGGIDAFVHEQADDYLERYTLYLDNFLSKDNVKLLRYEDMVYNFPQWLKDFFMGFGLPAEGDLYAKVLKKYETATDPSEAHPGRHRRKIEPGDYLCNLSPESIEFLNNKFERVLKVLDYSTQ